jgi:hypothetical protein
VQKAAAFFYTKFIKQDSVYRCFSYWANSGKLNCRSAYKDTLFTTPAGVLIRYYENGKVEDSTWSFENGGIKNTYHYYPSGRLWAHAYHDAATGKDLSEGYDEQGNAIAGFIYIREAEFPGGGNAWMQYLSTAVNTKVPVKKGAKKGLYNVIIRFIIETDGRVSNVEAETALGFGMEEEAMRVIKRSPKWSPLIVLGKTSRALRRQPITFQVVEE